MTYINELLSTIRPNTNHVVVLTNNIEASRELINEMRNNTKYNGEGRVFFKDDKRISIVTAGDAFDDQIGDYSLIHWAWYSNPDQENMKRVQKWESKAKEILTK